MLVISLPYGGSVTVEFNSYLGIENPIIRCVLCDNALWVGVWKYESPTSNPYPYQTRTPDPNKTH